MRTAAADAVAVTVTTPCTEPAVGEVNTTVSAGAGGAGVAGGGGGSRTTLLTTTVTGLESTLVLDAS